MIKKFEQYVDYNSIFDPYLKEELEFLYLKLEDLDVHCTFEDKLFNTEYKYMYKVGCVVIMEGIITEKEQNVINYIEKYFLKKNYKITSWSKYMHVFEVKKLNLDDIMNFAFRTDVIKTIKSKFEYLNKDIKLEKIDFNEVLGIINENDIVFRYGLKSFVFEPLYFIDIKNLFNESKLPNVSVLYKALFEDKYDFEIFNVYECD
jgi:hypothetical protein